MAVRKRGRFRSSASSYPATHESSCSTHTLCHLHRLSYPLVYMQTYAKEVY